MMKLKSDINFASIQSYSPKKKMLPDYDGFTTSSKIISSNARPILFQDIELLNSLSHTSIAYESFESCCS